MSELIENSVEDSQGPPEQRCQEAIQESNVIANGSTAPIEPAIMVVQKRKRASRRMSTIMNPAHLYWDPFCDKLLDSLEGFVRGRCKGNYYYTTAILKDFPGIDVDGSLKAFEEHGGFCDCQILSNIDKNFVRAADDFELLRYVAQVANLESYNYHGFRDSCISTSAATAHVLRFLGYKANPLRVRTDIWSGLEAEHGAILGSDGRRLPRATHGHWYGHLAVVVESRYLVESHYLVDPTLDQAKQPQRGDCIPPLVAKAPLAFFAGRECLELIHGNVIVRYGAFPARGGFKDADYFRRSQWMPVAENILKRIMGRLVRMAFVPQIPQQS